MFVYKASTSVRLCAARLVRLSFLRSGRPCCLIGGTSKKKHQALMAKPYLYDYLVGCHDADWPEQIQGFCVKSGGVDYTVDCVSEGLSVEKVSQTLNGSGKGKLAVFRSRDGGAW